MDNKIIEIKTLLESKLAGIDERRGKLAQHVHHRKEALPQDFSEQAVALENDETMVALEEELSHLEVQVRDALHRLELGTYGDCTSCGEKIASARLESLPETPLCVACAENNS